MSDTQHRAQVDDLPWDPEGRPAAGRAAHYRELAAMHLELGQESRSPEARAAHLELAGLWTRLAAQADGLHVDWNDPSA
jgi:hypothetical protein